MHLAIQTALEFMIIVAHRTQSLLDRYSFILGSQNVDFLGCLGRKKNQPKSNQITFHRGDFM